MPKLYGISHNFHLNQNNFWKNTCELEWKNNALTLFVKAKHLQQKNHKFMFKAIEVIFNSPIKLIKIKSGAGNIFYHFTSNY